MDATVLDSNYETFSMIDNFSSFIWTDRYIGYGDFEIYMPATTSVLSTLKQDQYISQRNSDRYMIIEKLETKTDVETGTYLLISGRSLESILERRIVWGLKTITGNFQSAIQTLLTENVISPDDPTRSISNFIFRPSTDERITSLNVSLQLIGDNLYDVIFAVCDQAGVGFRVLPEDHGGFIFELYMGEDRSYSQEILSWVVFSPDYENLLSSNYIETKQSFKNTALVGGEGEGAEQIMVEVNASSEYGLNRRETFVQASDISSSTEEGTLTPEEYKELLIMKGLEALAEVQPTQAFEGEINATGQFVYGKDFYIGDLVQVVNEYGMEARSRVSELIQTHDEFGESFIPTFITV